MEIPEPTLEVARGAGEAAGKTARTRCCLSPLGQEYPDLGLPARAGPALSGLCCPCRPAPDGSPPAGGAGGRGAPLPAAFLSPRRLPPPRAGPAAAAHGSLCPSHPEEAVRAGQGLLREDQDEEVKEETLVQAPVVSFPAWRRAGAWVLRALTPWPDSRGCSLPRGWGWDGLCSHLPPPCAPKPAHRPAWSPMTGLGSRPASPTSFCGLPSCPTTPFTFWLGSSTLGRRRGSSTEIGKPLTSFLS